VSVDGAIRSLRIVSAGIIAGLLIFGGVAFFVRAQGAIVLTATVVDGLLLVAGMVSLGSAAMFVLMSRQARETIRRAGVASRATAEPLAGALGAYRQLVIVRSALAEAPGLVGLMVYLVGGKELILLLPLASVSILLATIPSRTEVERLVEGSG
jgi:hypothetical protein